MDKERTLHVVIEKSDTNYSAYIEEVDGVVAVGSTIDEIKQNMLESIRIYKEVCEEDGFDVPDALKGDYEISFKMDMKHTDIRSRSFLQSVEERLYIL